MSTSQSTNSNTAPSRTRSRVSFEAGQPATEATQPSTPKGTNSPIDQAVKSGRLYVASLQSTADLGVLVNVTEGIVSQAKKAIDTRNKATEQGKDNTFIPKSVPKKPAMSYDAPADVKASEEYQALVREQQGAHEEFRKGEGRRVAKLTALKANYEEQQVRERIAKDLPFLAECAIAENGGDPNDYDPHLIVVESIGRFKGTIIHDSKLNAREFLELYMKVHQLDVCPSQFDSVGIHSDVINAVAAINVSRDASMTEDSIEEEITEEQTQLRKKFAQTMSYYVSGLIWVPLRTLATTIANNEKAAKIKAITEKRTREKKSERVESILKKQAPAEEATVRGVANDAAIAATEKTAREIQSMQDRLAHLEGKQGKKTAKNSSRRGGERSAANQRNQRSQSRGKNSRRGRGASNNNTNSNSNPSSTRSNSRTRKSNNRNGPTDRNNDSDGGKRYRQNNNSRRSPGRRRSSSRTNSRN